MPSSSPSPESDRLQGQLSPSTTEEPAVHETVVPAGQVRTARPHWSLSVRLSVGAALLAAVGNVIALLGVPRVYGDETSDLQVVAVAQDLVTLIVVVPMVLVLGRLASRDSARADTCLLGCTGFLVYNYAIYAFTVQFGPLFLLWVAVLGLSSAALVAGLTTMDVDAAALRYGRRAMPLAVGVLVAVPVLFTLLWLSEIVPDLLAGRPSTSAETWQVPTNPVHVLDLAFLFPAAWVSGVSLLRRRGFGYATAPAVLVVLALTCVPILTVPLVALARGAEPPWAVVPPVGVVLLVSVVALTQLLRTQSGRSADAADGSDGPGPSVTARPGLRAQGVVRGG